MLFTRFGKGLDGGSLALALSDDGPVRGMPRIPRIRIPEEIAGHNGAKSQETMVVNNPVKKGKLFRGGVVALGSSLKFP